MQHDHYFRAMRFEVLGPVRAFAEHDEELGLGGPQQRLVLGQLLAAHGSVVSTARLIDGVWGEAEPASAKKTLQGYIHHLRSRIGDDLRTEGAGYVLATHGKVDADEFERLHKEAAACARSNPARAVELLSEALALWNGAPYADLDAADALVPEIARLENLRVTATGDRIDADLALGRHLAVIGEVEALTYEHPLDERFRAQHMTALFRAGRQVEALRSFEQYRQYLADELGLEPSGELKDLEGRILGDDEELRSVERAGSADPVAVRGYELREVIGEGAFAMVWRGTQPTLGRDVAVKQIRQQLANDTDFIRRFEIEARIVSSIEHPFVVPLYDYWREPGAAFLVMRMLTGGTLETRLHDGPLADAELRRLTEQVGSALEMAHRQGVIHRDVKPGNILLDDDGNYFLTDFGIAFGVGDESDDAAAAALSTGSPAYAAPEQLRREALDARTDIYALGITLYEAATGEVPFADERTRAGLVQRQLEDAIPVPSAVRPGVAPWVDRAVAGATDKRRDDRFRSMHELIAEAANEIASATSSTPVLGGATLVDGELRNPFKGLSAFTEADTGDFHGRHRLVARFLEVFARPGSEGRLIAAVGPSGSGKSSAVRAGLIPELRRGAIEGSATWFITTMLPGSHPFEELESALLRVAAAPPGPLAELMSGTERGIARAVKQLIPDETAELVLVIDQFEELFTLVDDENERRRFIDGLIAAIEEPRSRLRLAVTIRADFWDRPLRYPNLAALLETAAVTVSPLSADELERAIIDPVAEQGVAYEPGLVARITAEVVDQPGALPLLQYTLTQLFDRHVSGLLTGAAFDELGGVAGSVAQRSEEIYGTLTGDQQAAARRAFGRLVTLGEGIEDTRRRVTLAELGSDTATREVIDQYGRARLLAFDHDPATRAPTVEVAHEALIREWPRLRAWLDDDRDALRIHRHLTLAAAGWAERDRDDGELYRGARLAGAETLGESAEITLNPTEAEYLSASLERREADAETERRRLRRLRRLVAVVGVALVLALIAGAFAVRQQRRADDEADAARAAAEEADVATLIARSAAQSVSDPELSVLLALEAHRRAPSTETEFGVLNALGSAQSPRRVASFPALDIGLCPVPPHIGPSGRGAYTIADGRLTRLDLTTGQVSDRGAAREPCGFYIGDSVADWAAVGSVDAETSFVGSYDDPYAVELQYSDPMWLSPDMDMSAGIAFGTIERGSGDFPAVLFDAATGAQIGDPIGQGAHWRDAIDPSGSFFAVSHQAIDEVGAPGQLRIVDPRTGAELFPMIETDAPVSVITFDPDEAQLIAGMASGDVMTVDLVTGAVASRVNTTATSPIRVVAVRPDGLVVALSEGQVETVDRRGGATGDRIDLRDVFRAGIRDDGLVVVGRSDGSFELIDLDGSALVERSWPAQTNAVAFDAGFATVLGDPNELVDLATGERTDVEVRDPDGNELAAGRLYPAPSGLIGVAFGEAGRGIMARWEEGEMVERVDHPGELFTWYRVGDTIASVGLDADNNEVASLSSLARGSAGIRFTVPAPGGTAAHPTPGGGMHVFDARGTLRSYGADGELIEELETGLNDVILVAIDSTTGRLAAASGRQPPIVIDLASGNVTQLPGPDSIVNLAFAHSAELLVITGANGDVTVWDVENAQLAGLAWDGTGANFAPQSWFDESNDSMWVFTSGQMIEIPLDPARWFERACEFVGRELSADEWSRYVPGESTPQSACA